VLHMEMNRTRKIAATLTGMGVLGTLFRAFCSSPVLATHPITTLLGV